MTITNQINLPLSASMRKGSQAEHTAAENSGFMSELLAGRVNARGYTDYLLRLRMIYAALESTAERLSVHPAVAAVADPALDRLARIDADLAYWAGSDLQVVESPATTAYQQRIEATDEWAPLFVAHHYTRYLGDLSGGQAIGRVLQRRFDLANEGVALYDFPAIPKPKLYKDAYRARLDELGLDTGQQDRVVAEVRVAFNLNQQVFDELGTRLHLYR